MKLYEQTEDLFIRDHYSLMTDAEIADALGRPESGIGSRRLKIRLLRSDQGSEHRGVRAWSSEDRVQLQELFTTGCTDEDIAIALGRTAGAVAQQRSSLGLRRADQPDHLKTDSAWNDDDDRVVAILFRRDRSDSQIGRALGRSACAIKDRRQTLGLWRDSRG